MASATGTLDLRPADPVSVRLEVRHDRAGGDAFYRGDVTPDATTGVALPNAANQTTLTLGMNAGF